MAPELTPSELEIARGIIVAALAEDLRDTGDLTSLAVLPPEIEATVEVVSRKPGRLSGVPIAKAVFEEMDAKVRWESKLSDGDVLKPSSVIAAITGSVRSLLSGERTALNFLTHLSGVASLTDQFVQAVNGTRAVILDTRKTLPGYRDLQKYAVRCGGGTNHRRGLFDAILIKDNHLAFLDEKDRGIPEVLATARKFSDEHGGVIVQVEVDTLEQLTLALPAAPDIVLLDNMNPETLRSAVEMRDEVNESVLLEASGGINLQTVRAMAESGVDRISIGALTHSAPTLDLGFDWP
ncbi:MAG: carboxylating nicotinate-nucleotide diphosphorylase [Planctomycetaceae bacterium]